MAQDQLDDPKPTPLQRVLHVLDEALEERGRRRLRLRVLFHPDPAAAEAMAKWLQ